MDEIEYKLNTKNSVLVVNAIDKLISSIKSKFKVGERQKFVVENEELKFLREKCSSKDSVVSLTACQGLLALVQLGILEIGHTMSTVVTLLPSAHNYSAIISTMAGLLTLDLKSRLVPGQPYTCQFSVRSPQHPFITVLERNKDAEDDVISQMHALCTHPDYIISSNSLELLRPVFMWLTCECSRAAGGTRPWQLLLSLPPSAAQCELLLDCVSCQQICNPKLIERAFAAYSTVTDAAIYQQKAEYVVALMPMLARVSGELIAHGSDPRSCYSLMERCAAVEAPQMMHVAGITVVLLAENLATSSALHLHELFNLCLNIISKFEISSVSLSTFVSLSLQWLHLPSYLTSSALKVASKILEIYEQRKNYERRLHLRNLNNNKTFQTLLSSDSHLSIIFKIHQIWESNYDNPTKLKSFIEDLNSINDDLKFKLLPFFLGITLENRKDAFFEEIVVRVVDILIQLVSFKKEVSVNVLPVLLYKVANDFSPNVKMACLKAVPLMAVTKENVPTIVAVLNKLKLNKGVPTSFLIMLYTRLAETQVRCFPYLQEILVDPGAGRPDDLKWETNIARAMAVKRICESRASTHGLELVPVISSILNKCTDKPGAPATSLALDALAALWRNALVAVVGAWRALEGKLARDTRPTVHVSMCKLLSEVCGVRVASPEYDRLISDTARRLWDLVASADQPSVVEAACNALATYRIEDYKLADIPEIYRRTVKLPAAYCKTPADAIRKPEDVLDYIPCEVWPEIFKYTNQAASPGLERLVSKLIEREIKGYRSGVYQPNARAEPRDATYLPPHSVVRGLLDCVRKQATSPTYEFSDQILLSILRVLTSEYSKPLPPIDLCFIHELYHRGALWRLPCVQLAARQANTSGSARRFLENYLQSITVESEKSDNLLFFELLPILCRAMPPNTLRPIIQRLLGESLTEKADIKSKDLNQEYTFIIQMNKIKECLECDKIHDANRTLVSQIVEHYFTVLSWDNIAWDTYVRTCMHLSSTFLERMTSPSGWWEIQADQLRKAAIIRSALAATPALVWLNEVIDAHASYYSEQEHSLQCMIPALKAAPVDDPATKEWFTQLMARTQVAFKETEDETARLYLCDVVILSVVVLSGVWVLEDNESGAVGRRLLLPAAVVGLMERDAWKDCTLSLLEWLRYTRDATKSCSASRACQRAMLTLRHTEPFIKHHIWKRLESHFGKNTLGADD